MFPTGYQAAAHPAPLDPGRWVGAVTYHYRDGSTLEELVPQHPATPLPRLFDTEAEALTAAQAWGAAHRLSDRTEVLTGVYGGES